MLSIKTKTWMKISSILLNGSYSTLYLEYNRVWTAISMVYKSYVNSLINSKDFMFFLTSGDKAFFGDKLPDL